ncbi:2-oxo acid dehydrogenase subunit E2 [Catellatospora methionotrophica]|uniref:2-oxo acid dehydrogenase subunit E2 n=1 Tax=Catellatospora methionotrophica TaxID=121620 RepID=UPI00340DA314
MPVSVTMPRLGESVTEGTVTRWLKQEGDRVEVDEPLLEVSTDKVDTEIPSPAAGILSKIIVGEDETAEVGAELAVIAGEGESPAAAAPAAAPAAEAPAAQAPAPAAPAQEAAPTPAPAEAAPAAAAAPAGDATPVKMPALGESVTEGTVTRWLKQVGDAIEVDEPLLEVSTDKVDTEIPSPVAGTLLEITVPEDETAAVGAQLALIGAAGGAPAAAAPAPAAPAPAAPAAAPAAAAPAPAAKAASPLRGRTEKLSRLRTTIAKRMVESLQVSAQLTTVVEVDVTKIAKLRQQAKADFLAKNGVKLSFLPFFALAAVEALRVHPNVNASMDLEAGTVTYHDAEHLGMAVDTDKGLIVPVIRSAGDLNLAGLARRIADVAERTRSNKILPDELSGGTFTLTNTGSRGALFDTPIINQPQVAILGTGAVVKRAVVVDDPALGELIVPRHMVYLALSYDHRLVDGSDAARFLGTVKERLETGAFEGELGL